MMSIGGSYKCEECDMSFNSERELKEHDKYESFSHTSCVDIANDDVTAKRNDIIMFALFQCFHIWRT
jgi:hypothetical protein